jgi:hypothetical protein
MVTLNPPDQLDEVTWLLSWRSDLTPPVTFYVYRDGSLLAKTTATELRVTIAPGTSPTFDVLDTADAPTPVYSAEILLTWYASPATSSYRVEELVGSTWTTRATIHDDGRGYFLWGSRALEDSQKHQFRVTSIGTNGNEGAAARFIVLMVRHPDPPRVTFGASNGVITIEAIGNPEAISLIAATYEGDDTPQFLTLVFDRAVDTAGLVGAQITVRDGEVNERTYHGTATVTRPDEMTVRIQLVDAGPFVGADTRLTATAGTGISAVGAAWAGVTNLLLPFVV